MTGSIVKRSTTMADGRELLYFDDPDTALGAERAVDPRDLPARGATATMRQDVLTGDWITVAAARQNRVMLPPPELDPLAPQSPTNESEVPSLYDVVVFENRTPSFGPDLPEPGTASALPALGEIGFERTAPAFGRCEVVCFSPDREGSFGTQTPVRARTVIEAWADRTAALSALPGIEQVFPFENRGREIGVTLGHPHGQIYAYPYLTPRMRQTLRSVEAVGDDLFARVLESELAGPRVVLQSEHWAAYVPFAARWPLELHLMPRRHVPDFAHLSDAERDDLATVYLRLLRGVDALYDTPTPYIAAWHQAPVHVARDSVRMHLELTSPRRAADKLKYLAGSEAAQGAWVADVVPEAAAERLRAAVAAVEV